MTIEEQNRKESVETSIEVESAEAAVEENRHSKSATVEATSSG